MKPNTDHSCSDAVIRTKQCETEIDITLDVPYAPDSQNVFSVKTILYKYLPGKHKLEGTSDLMRV